ncbi:MAG: hypothetical protein KAI83_13940 [Thiomargarita sp.]|nr:hypothetical protein [Thiomargarita sp.]
MKTRNITCIITMLVGMLATPMTLADIRTLMGVDEMSQPENSHFMPSSILKKFEEPPPPSPPI